MSISTQISRIPGNDKSDDTNHVEHRHISDLPNCVISDILSRLTMRTAVRTSVYKWTSIHDIELNDCMIFEDGSKKANFINFVERTLLLSRDLQSFRLSCIQEYDLRCLRTWIYAALSRDVHYLYMYYYKAGIIFPHNLFNWYSLRKLELDMPCTLKVLPDSCFPYLTTLKLERVEILNENNNSNLVKFNFPILETFMLSRCKWLNVKLVEIYAPKMTTFRSETSCDDEVNDYSIKITRESLVQFEFNGGVPENIVLSDGSKIVYAYLKNSRPSENLHLLESSGLQIRKLLQGLSSLKHLELSDFVGKAIALSRLGVPLPMYYKMERLALSYYNGNTEALLELLHAMPLLKILDIKVRGWEDHNYDVEEDVPLCILSRLEIIKFTCWGHTMHELLKLARLFFKKAIQLKRVCFFVWKFPCRLIWKNAIIKKLSTYPKASTSLAICFHLEDVKH